MQSVNNLSDENFWKRYALRFRRSSLELFRRGKNRKLLRFFKHEDSLNGAQISRSNFNGFFLIQNIMNDYEARLRDNPQADCIFFVTSLNFLHLVCHTVLLLSPAHHHKYWNIIFVLRFEPMALLINLLLLA